MIISTIGFKPMHIRPNAGIDLIVLLKTGKQILCSTCLVTSAEGQGIYFYHNKKAINEMTAKGWQLVK